MMLEGGKNSVDECFTHIKEWNEYGARLTKILTEAREQLGDAPLYVTEEGEFAIHPDVLAKLNEPGNEGPLELLRTMQRVHQP
jgi:hypothetical protein